MPWALPRRYLQIPSAVPLLLCWVSPGAGTSLMGQQQHVTVPNLALMFSLPSPARSMTSSSSPRLAEQRRTWT